MCALANQKCSLMPFNFGKTNRAKLPAQSRFMGPDRSRRARSAIALCSWKTAPAPLDQGNGLATAHGCSVRLTISVKDLLSCKNQAQFRARSLCMTFAPELS